MPNTTITITNDEPSLEQLDEVLTTGVVERVEYDDVLERHVVILDTGEAVIFSARQDGSHAMLAEVTT